MYQTENHLLASAKKVMTPIHRAGWPFVAMFAGGSAVLALLWAPLGWMGLLLTAWCLYFFRDPARVTPQRTGLIISPADGVVEKIVKVVPPPDLQLGSDERVRISVFLSVFDVHVNRMPYAGTVSKMQYVPGKFLNACLDKASEENERMLIKLTMPNGAALGVVQIAGLVARRIVCDVKEGQEVKSGERFGLIRFGSRVDLYLPLDVAPLVIEGQYVLGGETVMADLQGDEHARTGVRQ